MALKVHVNKRKDGHFLVKLEGRLDSVTAPAGAEQLACLADPATRAVVFDLHQLEYVSSAGLRVILKIKKAVAQHHGQVVFAGMQPQINKVLEISEIISKMDLFKSVESADVYLDAVQRRESVQRLDLPE